jgi:hypothetical protein
VTTSHWQSAADVGSETGPASGAAAKAAARPVELEAPRGRGVMVMLMSLGVAPGRRQPRGVSQRIAISAPGHLLPLGRGVHAAAPLITSIWRGQPVPSAWINASFMAKRAAR